MWDPNLVKVKKEVVEESWTTRDNLDEENSSGHSGGEDRVVAEVPVFMSKALQDKLYLLQCPLRPATQKFIESQVIEAQIKPLQGKIQFSFDVDTDTKRYDKSNGAKFVGADPRDAEERMCALLDTNILESVPTPQSAKSPRYIVGVIRKGKVYLTQLKSIVQMKPAFPYLDKMDIQKKATKPDFSGDTDDDTEEETVQITSKFSRPGGRDRNLNTYTAIQKSREEEPWTELTFFHYDLMEFEKLYAGGAAKETPFYTFKPDEYLNMLMPLHVETDVDPVADKDKKKLFNAKRLNFSQLKLLPRGEQIRAVLINGGVLHFDQVLDFLRWKLQVEDVDVNEVLKAVQTVAVLIRGCWVVKSDLVFPTEYVSAAHGIAGVLMQRARETILLEFVNKDLLIRKELCALTRLPSEEVTEILSRIARKVPKSTGSLQWGWEFVKPSDHNFIRDFPATVDRQRNMLEMRISRRKENELKPLIGPPLPGSSASAGAVSARRRSRSKSYSSDTDSGQDSDGKSKSKVFSQPPQAHQPTRRSSQTSTTNVFRPDQLVKPKVEPVDK